MPLVKVLSDETEREVRETLQQMQIVLASGQEALERIDRIASQVEQMLAAVMNAGKTPLKS